MISTLCLGTPQHNQSKGTENRTLSKIQAQSLTDRVGQDELPFPWIQQPNLSKYHRHALYVTSQPSPKVTARNANSRIFQMPRHIHSLQLHIYSKHRY
jgi:hypothetical protein